MSRRLFAGVFLAGLIAWAAAAVTVASHLHSAPPTPAGATTSVAH